MISKPGACQLLSFIKSFFFFTNFEFLGLDYEGHANMTVSRSDMTEENVCSDLLCMKNINPTTCRPTFTSHCKLMLCIFWSQLILTDECEIGHAALAR